MAFSISGLTVLEGTLVLVKQSLAFSVNGDGLTADSLDQRLDGIYLSAGTFYHLSAFFYPLPKDHIARTKNDPFYPFLALILG